MNQAPKFELVGFRSIKLDQSRVPDVPRLYLREVWIDASMRGLAWSELGHPASFTFFGCLTDMAHLLAMCHSATRRIYIEVDAIDVGRYQPWGYEGRDKLVLDRSTLRTMRSGLLPRPCMSVTSVFAIRTYFVFQADTQRLMKHLAKNACIRMLLMCTFLSDS